MWGYGWCFASQSQKAVPKLVSSSFQACGCSDQSSIASPTDNCACFRILRLRLSGGSFGLHPSSSESIVRTVSEDPVPAPHPPQESSQIFFETKHALPA